MSKKTLTSPKKARKRRKKKKNNYFTEETQNQLIDFIKSDSIEETNEIYNDHLYPVMDELIKVNIHVHKMYRTGYEYESLVQEVHLHLIEKFRSFRFNPETGEYEYGFDPTEGIAFSYCNRMIKNFLIQMEDKQHKRISRLGLDSIDDDENYYEEIYIDEPDDFQLDEFLDNFTEYMENKIPSLFEFEDEQDIANIILHIIRDDSTIINNKKTFMHIFKCIRHEKNYKINKVLKVIMKEYYVKKDLYSQYFDID